MITVRIESGQLRNELARLQREIGGPSRALMLAAARPVATLLRRHFRDRDQEGNKLGGRRTHFWVEILKSVAVPAAEATPRQAVVRIGDIRFSQKYSGGVIRPKNAKWLAIPAVSEAHGLRPQAFSLHTGIPLVFVRSGPDSARLQEAQSTKLKRTKKGWKSAGELGGRTIYWLKKSVTQAADPRALPIQRQIEAAALLGATRYVESKIHRN